MLVAPFVKLPPWIHNTTGRFFSGLGYLNEIHAHAWDFVDQPLVYQAFFGGQLAQDGLQMKWLAPTDTFIELGAEAGNGGAFPGTHRDRNGLNSKTLFTHVGGDAGDVLASEHDPSGDGARGRAGDRAQERRLAGAVGSHERQRLALLDGQRHLAHGLQQAVADVELVDLEEAHVPR